MNRKFQIPIEDVFFITGRGVVVTGRVETGCVQIGDGVIITGNGSSLSAVVIRIEKFRELLDQAEEGDNCGIFLSGVSKKELSPGMIVSSAPHGETSVERENKNSGEMEYIEELKACFEDGEMSKGERRLLEKLRIKLGISETRAAELEASFHQPKLTETELEYLDEYRECLTENGKILAGERRLLNHLRVKLGISEERARELEIL